MEVSAREELEKWDPRKCTLVDLSLLRRSVKL